MLVIRTGRAPSQSPRVAKELLRLVLQAAAPNQAGQVFRRDQRLLVLRTEQASLGDEHLALDLRGLGVLASITIKLNLSFHQLKEFKQHS